MTVSFLTPLAAFAAFGAVLPVIAVAIGERRARRVRQTLGVLPPPARHHVRWAVLASIAFALLGAAAAQPVLRVERTVSARADAEAYVVIDSSRSMLAAPAPGESTRFDRARRLARELRAEFPEIPFGVASLTDRPLPHLFPTADAEAFELVVLRALGIEKPPPKEPGLARATDLASLRALAKENFFAGTSAKRLAVLLSDGESRPFDDAALARELDDEAIGLVVVQLWDRGDRVWSADGTAERYRPDPAAGAAIQRLARAAGTPVFDPSDVGAIVAVARERLGTGPAVGTARRDESRALAPYLALAAAPVLVLLLLSGQRARRIRRQDILGPAADA